MLSAVYEKNASQETRALAGYTLALRLSERGNDEDSARADALLEHIVADLEGTKAAQKAQKKIDSRRFEVGRIAPDFSGEDVDGNPLKLSDYRGKVLVLDFWGFW